MEKFIVSARKYRPQTFDTVVGQEHITTTLRNAIKNQQLAHAFLFCGPRGVGKTTCARILAKTINCENPRKDGEACDTCQSCRSFNDGSSLNIHELDAASNNSVDDIRSLVEQVRFAPQAGKYKVYIIDEVHMLSSSAFNAFLKTLEEPPSYAIFILATTEKHKILPTILSRCQIFDFKRITLQDTVDHLAAICDKEHITTEKAALQIIAQKSEGCMRDALSIMDKIVSFSNGTIDYNNTLEHLNILDADYYFKLIEAIQQQDLAAAMLIYDDINRKGFEGDLVLEGFAEFMRNLLVCKDERVASLLDVVDSFKEKYNAVARKTSIPWIIGALNILNEAEIQYKAARNKRLHVELVLIKLTYLDQAITISIQDGQISSKSQLSSSRAVSFKRLQPKLQPLTPGESRKTNANQAESREQAAKLSIEQAPTPARQEAIASGNGQPAAKSSADTGKAKARLSMLDDIRKQVASRQSENSEEKVIPLEDTLLKNEWERFTEKLKADKNPAAQSFIMARLQIISPASFDIYSNNNLEQKFIEQERIGLTEALQKAFNNRTLQYNILVDEHAAAMEEPAERPLNTREQFMKLAEAYPLVKTLRDRLKLELDF